MSDIPATPNTPESTNISSDKRSAKWSKVHLQPSEEQNRQWTIEWKAKVQNEIDGYVAAREEIYKVYKTQKDMYDKWLSIKMKKMKKYDTVINQRKKVLIDINREIARLDGRLSSSTQQEET